MDPDKRGERQETGGADERTIGAIKGRWLTLLFRPRMLGAVAICAPLLSGCASLAQGAARDPDALWTIVHNVCVPDQKILANPAPCAEVDLDSGYVILKDPNPSAPTHFLLIR